MSKENTGAANEKLEAPHLPPYVNSNRITTLLNEIYQKQAEMATLAETILEHPLREQQIVAITGQLKRLAEGSLHNCEELELMSKALPSQAE